MLVADPPHSLENIYHSEASAPPPLPLKRASDRRKWPFGGPSLIPALALAVFLALPLLGLLTRAFGSGGLVDALARPIVLEALRLSAFTTVVVLGLSLLLGSPLALLLARRRFRGIGLLDSLVDLPIVLPPAVAGLALLLTFGRRGLLGTPLTALGIELPFTTAAVILASLFVAAPFYVRAARSGFLAVPRELEEAARVEGASEWQVFRFVTMPVAAPALFGGAILCWARALGEFGATIMFAGQFLGRTQTMPLAIYAALESDVDAALGLSVLLLAISFAVLIFFRRWLKEASYGVG
jgi:molybdate transport system permease protein